MGELAIMRQLTRPGIVEGGGQEYNFAESKEARFGAGGSRCHGSWISLSHSAKRQRGLH